MVRDVSSPYRSSTADWQTALPFLNHTEFLLSPLFVCGVLWLVSLFGFNIPQHVAKVLAIGAK